MSRPSVSVFLLTPLQAIGEFACFCFNLFKWSLLPPYRFRLVLLQFEHIGVGSLFIVLITGFFTGMVFALQSATAFAVFQAESLVGPAVTLSLTKELAPVLTSLMLTGRAGSSIATELGTMRVTEQIDAMETMAISPMQYLVTPRVIALTFSSPLLTILFDGIGIFGSYLIAVGTLDIGEGLFLQKIQEMVLIDDVFEGIIKSVFFGFTIAVIACFKGFYADGGAKGVGIAATQTVVLGSIFTFFLDYILTTLFFT